MSRDIQGAPSGAPVPTLGENEAIIERGLTSFVEVGQALTRIRDGRQYRETHATFEAYCRERWDFTPQRAGQMIGAAAVAETLETNVSIPLPATEGVARELKPLAKKPEKMAAAWQETVERHGPKPTAEQTRAIVQERMPPKRPKQHRTTGTALWEDEDVLAWLKKCIKAGMTRDEIGAASRTGARGWPGPSSGLPQDAGARAAAVVRDRERRVDGGSRRPPPRESGKRMRAISTERKRDPKPIRDVQYDMMRMVGILEAIDLPAEGLGDADEYLVADIFDDFTRLKRWVDSSMDTVIAHMDEERRRAKLRTLRERAEDPSSTPNERAVAGSAADRLEARVNAARLAAVNGTNG